MGDQVPATTSIRVNRVGNIDDDRLARRGDYLHTNRAVIASRCDSRTELAARAREIRVIADERALRSAMTGQGFVARFALLLIDHNRRALHAEQSATKDAAHRAKRDNPTKGQTP